MTCFKVCWSNICDLYHPETQWPNRQGGQYQVSCDSGGWCRSQLPCPAMLFVARYGTWVCLLKKLLCAYLLCSLYPVNRHMKCVFAWILVQTLWMAGYQFGVWDLSLLLNQKWTWQYARYVPVSFLLSLAGCQSCELWSLNGIESLISGWSKDT